MQELDPRVRDALHDATAAKETSYAPYSGFKMGAAVVTDTNSVVPGALIENISLGLAMCAERVALFATVAQGAGTPEVLALVSRPTDGKLTWPCGACLQVAMELGGPDLVIAVSDGKNTQQEVLKNLAPNLPHKA
jgi:cytidine deaminase